MRIHFSRNNKTALSIFTAILVIVLSNTALTLIPKQYTQLDLSKNKLYTLGNETKQTVSSLTDDISIYLAAPSGQEDAILVKMLEQYKGLSKHIKTACVDPISDSFFSQQYGENIEANSIVVSNGSRYKIINNSDIYITDYLSYEFTGVYNIDFDGEGQVTGAIRYVLSDTLPKLYTLSGHGEKELGTLGKDAVTKLAVDLTSLDLMVSGEIPVDAAALLLNAPSVDYTEKEVAALKNYLETGGSIFLTASEKVQDMPRLMGMLEDYGIEILNGTAMEDDGNFYQYPNYIIPSLQEHEITQSIADKRINIFIPNAQAIETNTKSGDAVLQSLLVSSEKAYLEKTDGEKVKNGPFDFAVAAEKGEGRLVVVSAASLLDDTLVQSFSVANIDFFSNTLQWMLRENHTSLTAVIPPKSAAVEYLTLSSSTVTMWSILSVIVLPSAILASGLLILYLRKQR